MPPGQAASDSITGQLERGWQGSRDCMQTRYARASDVVPAARTEMPSRNKVSWVPSNPLLFTASCICIESCAVLTCCQHLSPATLALRWAHLRLCGSRETHPSLGQSDIAVLHPHTAERTCKYWESFLITALNSALHQGPASTLMLVRSFCGESSARSAACYCWHHSPCPACGCCPGLSERSSSEQRLSSGTGAQQRRLPGAGEP